MKSWYVEHPVSDEILLDVGRFVDEAARAYNAMEAFNDFLNGAPAEFRMPEQ